MENFDKLKFKLANWLQGMVEREEGKGNDEQIDGHDK